MFFFSTLKAGCQIPIRRRSIPIRQSLAYSTINSSDCNNLDWKNIAEAYQKSTKKYVKGLKALIKEKDKVLEEREIVFSLRRDLEDVQGQLLKLKGNFNLRGALEFSLDAYGKKKNLQRGSKQSILKSLIMDPAYTRCLETVLNRYQLRQDDVNSCTLAMYHEMSKHAHGNVGELIVWDKEHTMTEVASLEAIFCALRKKDCFHLQLKVIIGETERNLVG